MHLRFPPFTPLVLLCGALLGACSGSDDADPPAAPPPAEPPAPQRGTLVGVAVRTGSYSASDLLSFAAVDPFLLALLQLVEQPSCTIEVWRYEYRTVGGRDEPTTATSALMVPKGTGARCEGPRPVLVYAHGTSTRRDFDVARLDDADEAEGLALAAAFAAQGYLVVAPNYAGYAGSPLPYHPYLNADQQSKDALDALAAARTAFATAGANAGAKLFVTGYSQGGYVAMAMHRALQQAGTPPTASAPLSGPYALAAFGDALFLGRVGNGAVANYTLLATSYQRSYGDIYATPGDMYAAKYANGIETALPGTTGVPTLVQQGVLPADALFESTPPAPEFADATPATEPAALAPVFARGFGSDALLRNAYRLAYLRDAQAAPDGGFPVLTTGQPPAAPANTLRRALKRNDLRGWTPSAPMFLCGGGLDPTVFWFNTELVARQWPASAPVTVLDVDAASPADDPYRRYRAAFSAARAALRLRGGESAVLASYHAGLVAPVCLAATREFFDAR